MRREIPITQARHELTALPEQLEGHPEAVAITRRGQPVLALLPWDFYETLVETLEVLGDQELMEQLRVGMKEVACGEVVDWHSNREDLLP